VSRTRDAFRFLFGALRIRPRSRRALTALSIIFALAGAGMLSFPLWTNLYTSRQQSHLAQEFNSFQFKTNFIHRQIAQGQVLLRIQIPKIGVNALVVEGTDPAALRAGAGHYVSTAFPCTSGNAGIAGHRTTYGHPFNRIDELQPGDQIKLITPEKTCTYSVIDGPPGTKHPHPNSPSWITTPTDGSVIAPLSGSYLTLTTCHPKGSAAKRLIVRAELRSA
jgi:sortase A